MNYFSYISMVYSHNNNLQKTIYQYLKNKERQIIAEVDIVKFKKGIVADIEHIVDGFPRCRPVVPGWRVLNDDKDVQLEMGGIICYFNIYSSI